MLKELSAQCLGGRPSTAVERRQLILEKWEESWESELGATEERPAVYESTSFIGAQL